MMEEEVSNEIHHSVIPLIIFTPLASPLNCRAGQFCPRCLKLGYPSSLCLIVLSVELHCSNDRTNSKESFSKKASLRIGKCHELASMV